MGHPTDEVKRIQAYLKENKLEGRCALSWNALASMKRRTIADHLYKEVKATEKTESHRFCSVRHLINTQRLRDIDFRIQIGKENAESTTLLMQAAWPYLALCYSRINGFNPEWFAENYERAMKG